jgi:hypothetical protein
MKCPAVGSVQQRREIDDEIHGREITKGLYVDSEQESLEDGSSSIACVVDPNRAKGIH